MRTGPPWGVLRPLIGYAAYGAFTWDPARPLRDRRTARSGRDGGGVSGPGHAAGADGGHQDPSRAPGVRPGAEGAVRARGAGRLRAEPSPHLHAARPRRA